MRLKHLLQWLAHRKHPVNATDYGIIVIRRRYNMAEDQKSYPNYTPNISKTCTVMGNCAEVSQKPKSIGGRLCVLQ